MARPKDFVMEGKRTCGMSSEVSFGFKVRITRTISFMQSSRIGNMFSSSRLAHHSLEVMLVCCCRQRSYCPRSLVFLVKYH
jgi:hypothetical protein